MDRFVILVDAAYLLHKGVEIVSRRASIENPTAPGTIDSSTKRIDSVVDRALIYHVFLTLAHGALATSEQIHAPESFRMQIENHASSSAKR